MRFRRRGGVRRVVRRVFRGRRRRSFRSGGLRRIGYRM